MTIDWTDDMAGLLQTTREDLGWSRQKLAAEAGVSERTIVDLENNYRPGKQGTVQPRKSTVIKIVRTLNHPDLAALADITLPATASYTVRTGSDRDLEILEVLTRHLMPAIEEIRELFADSDD